MQNSWNGNKDFRLVFKSYTVHALLNKCVENVSIFDDDLEAGGMNTSHIISMMNEKHFVLYVYFEIA